MPDRPHILILMSDEHRADVAGFAGDSVVRTPTLDWLAEGGVVFQNAYTPSPICVPSRQCILAGQYPRSCGCEGWVDLEPGYRTYPREFARHGYRTVACGKMHLLGPDQLQGWQQRPVGDVSCSRVPDPAPDYRSAIPDVQDDDELNVAGMSKWSDRKEIYRAGPGRVRLEDRMSTEGLRHWIDDAFAGTWYDRHQPERPSLLYLGLHDPHYPYICDEDAFRYYLPRVKPFACETPFDHPFLGLSPWPPETLEAGVDISQRAVQRARAAYYAMVEGMDRHCAQVLESLRLAGEDLDEWIIVYLSDHGDQLGEHGVWEKQKFFEGSARVPFVIRAPKYLPAGKTIDANVSLVDLFPTLCELAGVPVPEGLDGVSLADLAHGRQQYRVHGDTQDEVCSFFLQQGYSNGMIKQGALKYQWYHHERTGEMPEVLFDLARDPTESVNLIDDARYTHEKARFRARRDALGYGV